MVAGECPIRPQGTRFSAPSTRGDRKAARPRRGWAAAGGASFVAAGPVVRPSVPVELPQVPAGSPVFTLNGPYLYYFWAGGRWPKSPLWFMVLRRTKAGTAWRGVTETIEDREWTGEPVAIGARASAFARIRIGGRAGQPAGSSTPGATSTVASFPIDGNPIDPNARRLSASIRPASATPQYSFS